MQCVCPSLSRGLHSDSGQRQDSRHWSIPGTLRPQVNPLCHSHLCFSLLSVQVCWYISCLLPLLQCSVLLPVTPDSSLLFPARCPVLLALAPVFSLLFTGCVLLSLKDPMLSKQHTRASAGSNPCDCSNQFVDGNLSQQRLPVMSSTCAIHVHIPCVSYAVYHV